MNRCMTCGKFKKWEELVCCEIPYSEDEYSYYECVSCIYNKEENSV